MTVSRFKLPRWIAQGLFGLIVFGCVATGGVSVSSTTAMAQDYDLMSCRELWYERNGIYAGRGYCFETRRARRVFGRRCYPPYGRLRGWERRVVNAIRRYERRRGCR
jgi:hypothetical protein